MLEIRPAVRLFLSGMSIFPEQEPRGTSNDQAHGRKAQVSVIFST